ncbi:hypothetical protein DYB35_010627 [Aphanomyces astaci]|uniref:USP domain-containing protein n=1 Tax=Aphanomyces astaci TaxID=112090 RepID=A0A3R7ARV8_APHAT|nr:hypothetical protein DYB35_010627 [Aphanomyces astaci]
MVQQVWVCQDEWQTLPLDSLFPVDCTMANVSIGHSNLPWSENGVQVLISPIKLFVRGDQVQKLCDSIEAYSVESVFFKKDVLDNLPLLRNVRAKQRHIISFTSRHQISMATLARCMLGVGISTVFCSNFGVKTRLMDKEWSEHEWFVRLFELAKQQSFPLSMTMDFGFNMNALPRQFSIPPDSQGCIYGFDPSYKFERHPSSTLYPLFSSTSGAPMVNYFTSTEHRQVAYCVDDTSTNSVDAMHVELIKVKVYSEIYHLLMGHNKTRSKQFLLSKTSVLQANNCMRSCRAFLEDAWNAKRFQKSSGCRIEFSFKITDCTQLSNIRDIVLAATQLTLMPHLHRGIRYCPREQYESNLLSWLELLDRSIPKSRSATILRAGVVHFLHGMLNANGYWNRSIAASLNQLVTIHKNPGITFDSILEAKETFRLLELESYISSNFREALVPHRDSNVWRIQTSAVLFVTRTNVDLSSRGRGVLKNPPLFGVQLQHGCSDFMTPSRSPMELFEAIWAKWQKTWTRYVMLLPTGLTRKLVVQSTIQPTSRGVVSVPVALPVPPTSHPETELETTQPTSRGVVSVPVNLPVPPTSHPETELEKALFVTDVCGLNEIKKHISIQQLPKSGMYMVRDVKGHATKDIAASRDANTLCKAVWKKYGDTWRKMFSTTSARICTSPGTDKRDEYNLSNALFLEPNLEFSKAKLWLDIFIHPKFYSTPGFLPVFAVSTKETPCIWDGVRCVEDPNAFVRSVVLACPNWEHVLRLRKKKRSILSYSQFMAHCTEPNEETSRSEQTHEFIGIVNPGNFSCYQNVIYQCLFALHGFSVPSTVSRHTALEDLRLDLMTMRERVSDNLPAPFVARKLYERLNFAAGEHQDAMEFLQLLLDAGSTQIQDNHDATQFIDPWYSSYTSQLKCVKCKYATYASIAKVTHVLLPCDDNVSVDAELKKITGWHGHETVLRQCPKCKSGSAIRADQFVTFGTILVVCFRRVVTVGSRRQITRVPGKPQFQEILSPPNPTKQLFGIIMHSGSMNSGHYTCYVRSTRSLETPWYGVNDEAIINIGTFEAMKTEYIAGHEDDVYSLFYT